MNEVLFQCSICGGNVLNSTGPNRKKQYTENIIRSIPDDFEIPTCEKCGNVFINVELSRKLDDILFEKHVLSLAAEASVENWDLESGEAIQKENWDWAINFNKQVRNKFPDLLPFVAPCGDGTVHLTWEKDKGYINIEYKGKKCFATIVYDDRRSVVKRLISDNEAITEIIKFFS